LQNRLISTAGFPRFSLSDFVCSELMSETKHSLKSMSYEQLEKVEQDGLPIGRMAQISTRWFLAANDIKGHLQGLKVYRDFVLCGVLASEGARSLMEEQEPDIVFLLNGLFLEERIAWAWAERFSIPVVSYERGFHRDSFIFARNKIACRFDLSDHWPDFADKRLSEDEEQWIEKYLQRWRDGTGALVQYWPKREDRLHEITRRLGLASDKKTAVAFTNVVWDSAVQERDLIFENLFEWIGDLVDFLPPIGHASWSYAFILPKFGWLGVRLPSACSITLMLRFQACRTTSGLSRPTVI
jgi:hypothetical protein